MQLKKQSSTLHSLVQSLAPPCPEPNMAVKAAAKHDISSLLKCLSALQLPVTTAPTSAALAQPLATSWQTRSCLERPTSPCPGLCPSPAVPPWLAVLLAPVAASKTPATHADGVFLLEPSEPGATLREVQIRSSLRILCGKSQVTASQSRDLQGLLGTRDRDH